MSDTIKISQLEYATTLTGEEYFIANQENIDNLIETKLASINQLIEYFKSNIDNLLNLYTPTGTVHVYPGAIDTITDIPGWLLCDGSEVSRKKYTKLYDVKESNDFIYLVKSIFWFFFFYLYEFIAILVLITGLMTFLKYIDSVEINTVITMFYLFFIVGIVLWSMYKYKILKPKLDDTYMRDENNKRFTYDLLNCKDSYEKNTGNSMFNIFIASDAYNKHIIDEHIAKKKQEMHEKKPSGLQKTFGSMASFFGDKMQSANSFIQSKTENISSTFSSGIGDVNNLLKSKYDKTKENIKDAPGNVSNMMNSVGNMMNSVGNMFTSNNTQR